MSDAGGINGNALIRRIGDDVREIRRDVGALSKEFMSFKGHQHEINTNLAKTAADAQTQVKGLAKKFWVGTGLVAAIGTCLTLINVLT